jgi:membrane protein
MPMSPTPISLQLYPKISSIYNKIMQLAIAITLILVVLHLWQSTTNRQFELIDQQFSRLARIETQQIAQAMTQLISNDEAKTREQWLQYIEVLTTEGHIDSVVVYDQTGQRILSTEQAKTMNELYGLAPHSLDKSQQFVPFVGTIEQPEGNGYIRVTYNKQSITKDAVVAAMQQQQLIRIMMLLSLGAGFFLTRGLSRFSRQSYRIPKV